MKPHPIRPAAIGRDDTLAAKLRLVETRNADLSAKVAGLEAALAAEKAKLAGTQTELADALRHEGEAHANARYWRDAADAARALESRYRDTIVGLGHALADLKLAEADLEADGR